MKAVTIIATKQFDRMAKDLLTATELAELEFAIALNPVAHPVIAHTDGVRKARWSRVGMGKRTGVRVIYYYAAGPEVVLMLPCMPRMYRRI